MAFRQSGIIEKHLVRLRFIITTGLQIITFANVLVNLELLLIEKFVVYEPMVKILATLKSPHPRGCHLMKKVKPVIEKVYLP